MLILCMLQVLFYKVLYSIGNITLNEHDNLNAIGDKMTDEFKLVLLQISFFTSSITSLPHLVTLLSRKILAILQYCCGFPPSEACQSGATLRAIREKTYLAKH